ncbi:hypothetical protein FB451DRAFT_1242780 [Mycena latifolia]|nr:hypothetical protein FB451DRAFT_1242780 [Mycena latifolia]
MKRRRTTSSLPTAHLPQSLPTLGTHAPLALPTFRPHTARSARPRIVIYDLNETHHRERRVSRHANTHSSHSGADAPRPDTWEEPHCAQLQPPARNRVFPTHDRGLASQSARVDGVRIEVAGTRGQGKSRRRWTRPCPRRSCAGVHPEDSLPPCRRAAPSTSCSCACPCLRRMPRKDIDCRSHPHLCPAAEAGRLGGDEDGAPHAG